jgi:hypothetical protein
LELMVLLVILAVCGRFTLMPAPYSAALPEIVLRTIVRTFESCSSARISSPPPPTAEFEESVLSVKVTTAGVVMEPMHPMMPAPPTAEMAPPFP